MILNCPSCSASYMVPAEAIGDNGRDVRCKKCGHVWFQESEKETLDALISRIQSTDIDEDDISFADLQKVGKARVETSKKSNNFIKNIVNSIRSELFLKRVSSVSVAAACLSLLMWGAVIGRVTIVHAVPSLSPVYTNLGFPMSGYHDINPEDALVLEKVELVSDSSGNFIKGNLINLSSSPVRIPRFVVVYVDTHGEEIKKDRYKMSLEGIAKEGNLMVSLPVPHTPPEGTAGVQITFTE